MILWHFVLLAWGCLWTRMFCFGDSNLAACFGDSKLAVLVALCFVFQDLWESSFPILIYIFVICPFVVHALPDIASDFVQCVVHASSCNPYTFSIIRSGNFRWHHLATATDMAIISRDISQVDASLCAACNRMHWSCTHDRACIMHYRTIPHTITIS